MVVKSLPVTVTVLTCNSERTLKQCLDSLSHFSEVIVVDSGSHDRTKAVATCYSNALWYEQDWLGYAQQKQWAANKATNDWVLNLDSDEFLDQKALLYLQNFDWQTLDNTAITFKIHEHFLGRANHFLTKANRKIRCFRRSRAAYSNHLVHEGVVVQSGSVCSAAGNIHHLGEYSHEIKVSKINAYSSLKAQEAPPLTLFQAKCRMLLIFPLAFLRSYVIKRQLLNGFHGFSASMVNAFYAYLKAAKHYEKIVKN